MTVRVVFGAAVASLGLAAAGCQGKVANSDSAVQADRAAAATDTSGSGAMTTGTPGGQITNASTSRAQAAASGSGAAAGRPAPGGPSHATSIRPVAGADTLRGIVKVVGGGIDAHPVVAPHGGGATVTLTGPHAATLRKVSGTEVWITGSRQGATMTVDRFLVRAVNGVPAMDGTVTARDGGFALMITGEHVEHPLGHPPTALRSHVGHRVWITGPLESDALTFGVIDLQP